MSEHINKHNSDDHEQPTRWGSSPFPEYTDQVPFEFTEVLQDANKVQEFLNAQIYLSENKLFERTHSIVRRLNTSAMESELINQHAGMIMPNFSSTEDLEIASGIFEGKFRGFVVLPVEVSSPYSDTDDQTLAFQPRLHFHVEENSQKSTPQFRYGDVSDSSIVFSHTHQQINLALGEHHTDEEQTTVEHFNLFNQEFSRGVSDIALRKAATLAFYLMNKSRYKNIDGFEDMIVDTASHHISLDTSYDIETDFCMTAANVEGQPSFDFIQMPGETIHLNNAPLKAITSLPRSFIANTKSVKNEITLKDNQKSLYLTIMQNDKTYHIPFEHVREINLNQS